MAQITKDDVTINRLILEYAYAVTKNLGDLINLIDIYVPLDNVLNDSTFDDMVDHPEWDLFNIQIDKDGIDIYLFDTNTEIEHKVTFTFIEHLFKVKQTLMLNAKGDYYNDDDLAHVKIKGLDNFKINGEVIGSKLDNEVILANELSQKVITDRYVKDILDISGEVIFDAPCDDIDFSISLTLDTYITIKGKDEFINRHVRMFDLNKSEK